MALAITGITFMIISAQEVWGTNKESFYSNLNFTVFYVCTSLFLLAIFLVHFFDYSKTTKNRRIVVLATIISLLIDLGVLFCAAFLVLLSINQISTDILKSINGVFFLSLPWALGAVTLSSLSVDRLHKRAKDLQDEIAELKEKTAELEEDRKKRERKQAELEREFNEFKKKGADLITY